jgi:outer membrane protein OmpA-like peptidoglycan-associated protein
MSNFATPGRFLPDLQSAVSRTALLKLVPILLATVLVGCSTKGGRTSGLEHSTVDGANAAGAQGSDWSGSPAGSSADSSTESGAAGGRYRAGARGAANGRDQTNASIDGRGDAQGMADDDSADEEGDSSLTDGAPGDGKSGGTRGRGRRGKNAGQAVAGAPGDKTTGIDSAAAGDAAVAGATGGAKGKRAGAGRRRGGAGAPGSNSESPDMNAGDDEDSDTQIAAVEVTKGKVQVNEEYQPLTLGGVLPVVLGVNEEGRFDFDQYALRPEVRTVLDALADTLKTAEYDRLDILGYTDRIGAADYNRRLSELRAYAVAQYLMRRGVPEYKIRYEGRGDNDPLTRSDECQGLAREDLITCLQKDRRVEIEASIHRKRATVVQ